MRLVVNKVELLEEVLARVEPIYFLDYALFTGAVRHYASVTLEAAFKTDPHPLRRRLHFVNLLKEEYAAYEDVGAFLGAFLLGISPPLGRHTEGSELFGTSRVSGFGSLSREERRGNRFDGQTPSVPFGVSISPRAIRTTS